MKIRKPSRLMPSYQAHDVRPGAVSWLILFSLLALLGYVFWQGFRGSVVVVSVIAAVSVGFGILHRQRLSNLAQERQPEGICEFARGFDIRAVDTWVVRATFEQLQNHLASEVSEFPIRPDDELEGTLSIDAEDIEDIAREIAQRAGRSLENVESNPYFGRVVSARDLVMFLQAQPSLDASLDK